MIKTLQGIGLDEIDLRIAYWIQTASVELGEKNPDDVKMFWGVRQDCILSPLLFNIYSEYIFRETLKDVAVGISANGRMLNNIRYADDTVMSADISKNLQLLIDRVVESNQRYGLQAKLISP